MIWSPCVNTPIHYSGDIQNLKNWHSKPYIKHSITRCFFASIPLIKTYMTIVCCKATASIHENSKLLWVILVLSWWRRKTNAKTEYWEKKRQEENSGWKQTSTPWWQLSFDELKTLIMTCIWRSIFFEHEHAKITAGNKASGIQRQLFLCVNTIEKALNTPASN